MRVLIADKFSAEGKASLATLGLSIDDRPELGADDLPDALAQGGASVLVVRSTKVTAEAIGRASALSLIIRAGAGVNTIDLEAASTHGVFVANTPGKNAIAVAELTMGLILSLDRSIPDAVAELRGGHWLKKRFGKARGLFGRRLGLVGFGAIGREVALRANAFGMDVHAYDVALTDADAEANEVTRASSLEALLGGSDVVSVHVPYIKGRTHHLIGEPELAAMKDGAVLVHTARGGVVDDAALAEALRSGRIRAALDVFEGEPADGEAEWSSPLLQGPGVYGTPHIGASTDQASDAIADEVVRIIADYLQQGVVHHCVNIQRPRGEGCTVVIRHLDRVGVLAAVLDAFQKEQLNVQEMHNVIFDGNAAASATISLAHEPSRQLVARLESRDDVLAVSVRPPVIKYLGSKRVLVPALVEQVRSLPDVRTFFDVFSGTARVGHAMKEAGLRVRANDHNAYAQVLAQCYVAADRDELGPPMERLLPELQALPPRAGYITHTFCEQARFFHPNNGARIDAIRDHIEALDLPPALRAVALVSLMEAADRVDSTTGVQMAYLKQWAPRAHNDLELRMPRLLPGPGDAHGLDALEAVQRYEADVVYLDPPYNQHSYLGNYHVWETLVRWDAPVAYGVAKKRLDCKTRRSPFNSKRKIHEAMQQVVRAVQARWLLVSFSNEGYISRDEMLAILSERGPVEVQEIAHDRYVGAKIGIYNLEGRKVGRVGHLKNVEYLFRVRCG